MFLDEIYIYIYIAYDKKKSIITSILFHKWKEEKKDSWGGNTTSYTTEQGRKKKEEEEEGIVKPENFIKRLQTSSRFISDINLVVLFLGRVEKEEGKEERVVPFTIPEVARNLQEN